MAVEVEEDWEEGGRGVRNSGVGGRGRGAGVDGEFDGMELSQYTHELGGKDGREEWPRKADSG